MTLTNIIRLLALVLILIVASIEDVVPVAATCDTPPACQCECLNDWDECAEGLSTVEARDKCDDEYEDCWDDNCDFS